MKSRFVYQWFQHRLAYLPFLPLKSLYRYGLRGRVKTYVDNVGIADMNFDDSDDNAYVESTVEALELMRCVDSRRDRP